MEKKLNGIVSAPNIKDINDIIKELKEHPNYVHSEIFTVVDIQECIENVLDGKYENEEQLHQLVIQHRKKITNSIKNWFGYCFDNFGDSFFPDELI